MIGRGWLAGLGAIALVLVGALGTLGAKAALDLTNTVEFCTSCHEMKDNNYAEYRDTIHASNRTGVRAGCPDCHVPRALPDELLRKLYAVNDLVRHFTGRIDTREKFEEHRPELAMRVWAYMKASDSRECRQCHDAASMSAQRQGRTARKQHEKLALGERTCIDCHYGIAHREPQGLEPRDALARR